MKEPEEAKKTSGTTNYEVGGSSSSQAGASSEAMVTVNNRGDKRELPDQNENDIEGGFETLHREGGRRQKAVEVQCRQVQGRPREYERGGRDSIRKPGGGGEGRAKRIGGLQ